MADEMREALQPFAELGDKANGPGKYTLVEVEHLRKASAALAASTPPAQPRSPEQAVGEDEPEIEYDDSVRSLRLVWEDGERWLVIADGAIIGGRSPAVNGPWKINLPDGFVRIGDTAAVKARAALAASPEPEEWSPAVTKAMLVFEEGLAKRRAAEPGTIADGEAGCQCHGCGALYRVDINVSDALWQRIARGDRLLCGRCICSRIEAMGEFGAFRMAAECPHTDIDCARQCYACGEIVPEPGAGGEWQPIETKPSAPVQVELFFGRIADTGIVEPYRDERRSMAYWDGEHFREMVTGHRVCEFEDDPDFFPTHWRPLPAPPLAAAPQDA